MKRPTPRTKSDGSALSEAGPENEKRALTHFGCPDCNGVLSVVDAGPKGYPVFRCRVGHAYAGDSVIRAKEDRLEGLLWGLVETLEELAELHRILGDRAGEAGADPIALAYAERAAQADAHAKVVRELISHDRPVVAGHPED